MVRRRVDHISSLPDDVIISILSRLPFHDAVRTGVLSSKWQRLWTRATPCIDDSSVHRPAAAAARGDMPEDWVAGVVRSFLADYEGPIQTCRLRTFLCPSLSHCVETICGRGGLTELEINGTFDAYMVRPDVPEAILPCESLKLLKLVSFNMPDLSLSRAQFLTNLKKLDLCNVRLTDLLLLETLNACNVLEEFGLRYCLGLDNLEICLPSLRKLAVMSRNTYPEYSCISTVIIKDAPNLEEFLSNQHLTVCTRLTVRHAPKLRVNGWLSMDTNKLDLYGNTFETPRSCKMIESLVTMLPNIKRIGIILNPDNQSQLRKMIHLLRCCPCLEKLYIEFDYLHSLNTRRGLRGIPFPLIEEGPFNCLEYHLTQVHISGFTKPRIGQKDRIKIINFLIQNAKVLKLMDIKYEGGWRLENTWVIAMEHLLNAEKKASPRLKIRLYKSNDAKSPLDPWDLKI